MLLALRLRSLYWMARGLWRRLRYRLRLLRWRSLSGVQNSGFARFERGANDNVTTVTLTIEYTLPDVAAIVKLVNNGLAQRFVRKTMLGTMETFKEALEAEAAGTLTGAASGDAAQP